MFDRLFKKYKDEIESLKKENEELMEYNEKLYNELSNCNIMGPGVYFLFSDNELVYIGKSMCILQRLGAHTSFKSFDDYLYINLDVNYLNKVESYLIRRFNPPYNKTVNKDKKTISRDFIENYIKQSQRF